MSAQVAPFNTSPPAGVTDRDLLWVIAQQLGAVTGSASSGGVTFTPARGNLSDYSGTITSGGSAQNLRAANTSRRYFLFQNISDADMYVNFIGTAAAANGSVLCPANGGGIIFENGFVPTGAISVFGATTGKAFTCYEA